MDDHYMESDLLFSTPADSLQIAGFSAPLPLPADPLALLVTQLSGDSTLTSAPALSAGMNVSLEEQRGMMSRIQEIFELEEEVAGGDAMDEDGDEEEVVDVEDQERRTEKLMVVLKVLSQLWWSNSELIDLAVEKLADGSRDPKWRIPIGDSGILDFFLANLSGQTLRHNLNIHVLRLIGNSCADTDENRARVVASNNLPLIIIQLRDTSLVPFAIPVLYNICIDYEPAQLAATNSYLGKELLDLVSSPSFRESRAFLGYACKLLGFLAEQPTGPELAPDNTAIALMKIAADRETPVDMEDFISIGNTAVVYLQHEKFQKAVMAYGALNITLAMLLHSYTRFDSNPLMDESQPGEDETKALQALRSSLNQVMSDISALSEFKAAVPVTSSWTSSLRRWLSSPQLQLQVCACIMLGNLARSDAACEEFVHTSRVHIPLIAVLTDATDSQLLHAALGFLKNLALPIKNKEPLGEAGLFEVLPRLWLLDTLQQIQFSSISLARQLINNTHSNVKRICQRLSPDEDSPANMRSRLSFLIALFDRTDVEPIKMEIARLITAVVRVYSTHLYESPEQIKGIRERFFAVHPDVGRPLSFMVSQTKWPVVRSEGWFVFALAAGSPEGAQCISDMMQDVAVFQPLVQLLTGKSLIEYQPTKSAPDNSSSNTDLLPSVLAPESAQPHAQADEMARIDRENALVLVSELLKNRGSEMAAIRRTTFEDLLRGGGELVMSYRDGKAETQKQSRASVDVNLHDAAQQSISELYSG